MKLSVLAVSKFSEIREQNYLPIVIYLESEEDISINSSYWSPSCFPFRESVDKNNNAEIIFKHWERAKELLGAAKEIGCYYPRDHILTVDKELFFHYLLSGCKISKALRRLLQKLEYDLTGMEKFRLDNLMQLEGVDAFKVKSSSNILDISEKFREFNR